MLAHGWTQGEPNPLPVELPMWFQRALLRATSERLIAAEQAADYSVHVPKDDAGMTKRLSPKALLALNPERRREILRRQAETMVEQYASQQRDMEDWQRGDILDY